MAFLKAEWKILTYFAVIVAILLGVMGHADEGSHWSIAVAFLVGAVFSAVAGYIGMNIATKANVRTAQAARTSLAKALQVSFTGGSVMGLGVARPGRCWASALSSLSCCMSLFPLPLVVMPLMRWR